MSSRSLHSFRYPGRLPIFFGVQVRLPIVFGVHANLSIAFDVQFDLFVVFNLRVDHFIVFDFENYLDFDSFSSDIDSEINNVSGQ